MSTEHAAQSDATLACDQRCQVPEGVTLTEVPPSRHAWSDLLACPNDGCGRQFLVTRVTSPASTPEATR